MFSSSDDDDDDEEFVFGPGVAEIADAHDDDDDDVAAPVIETKKKKKETVFPPRPRRHPPCISVVHHHRAPLRGVVQDDRPFASVDDRGRRVVSFEGWLATAQEYADDLKFVNDDAIDVLGLRILQDRRLGKGGFLWDGAYVLAERVSEARAPRTVLELGGGTAVAGLAAKMAFPEAAICLTDGDSTLLDLARRNAALNDLTCDVKHLLWTRNARAEDHDEVVDRYWTPGRRRREDAPETPPGEEDLDDDDDDERRRTFDLILAAECVAPIYDPVALLDTIRRFATPTTEIWLVVKHARFPEHAATFYDLMRQSGFHIDVSVPRSKLKHAADFNLVRAKIL